MPLRNDTGDAAARDARRTRDNAAESIAPATAILVIVALCALVVAGVTGGALWARWRSLPRGAGSSRCLPLTAQVVWGS